MSPNFYNSECLTSFSGIRGEKDGRAGRQNRKLLPTKEGTTANESSLGNNPNTAKETHTPAEEYETTWRRVKWQSCDQLGPQPLPHPSL